MLIWLILIFLAPLSSAQQQKSDCSYTPEVNERFGSDYLSTACERKLNWLSTAFSGVGKSLSDIMDDSQLQYFNKIQTCDFNCICSAFDWCKDLLKGVEVLLTVELLSFLIIIGWSFKAGIDAVKNISSINGIEVNLMFASLPSFSNNY